MEFLVTDDGIEFLQKVSGCDSDHIYSTFTIPKDVVQHAFIKYIVESGILEEMIKYKNLAH